MPPVKKPALPGQGSREAANATFLQRLKDAGIDVTRAGILTGETAVGFGDIATMGHAGKALNAATGWDPKAAHEILSQQYSEERQYEQEELSRRFRGDTYSPDNSHVKNAFNLVGLGSGLGYALANPAPVVGTIIQSLPLMLAGRGIAGKMIQGGMRPALAGGIGEGAVTAAASVEGIRQETPDGLVTPKQLAYGVGAGAVTGAIGAGSARVSKKFGLEDVDVPGQTVRESIEQGARKSLVRRIGEGALVEGTEEILQSTQEQIANNLALDKPWNEGIEEAAGMGLLSGAAMGGVMQGVDSVKKKTFNAYLNKQRVEEEKQKALQEEIDKTTADVAAKEEEYKAGVQAGKKDISIIPGAVSRDTATVEKKVGEAQDKAGEAIAEVEGEAQALQEFIEEDAAQSIEAVFADRITRELDQERRVVGAGREFPEVVMAAARMSPSVTEFQDQLVALYGEEVIPVVRSVWNKVAGIKSDFAQQIAEGARLHTKVGKGETQVTVNQLAREEQKAAGWNENWPFVPADLGNADFRKLIATDETIPPEERQKIFEAGKALGVISKKETLEDYTNITKPLKLKRVISGLQSGADTAALDAAHASRIKTGGTAAAKYERFTDDGRKERRPDLAAKYGLIEGKSVRKVAKDGVPYTDMYQERTVANAQEADGTIWFGDPTSPGGRLTLSRATQKGKPKPLINPTSAAQIRTWLNENNIETLNVAGNREHTNKGIYKETRALLEAAFTGKDYESQKVVHKKLDINEEATSRIISGQKTILSSGQPIDAGTYETKDGLIITLAKGNTPYKISSPELLDRWVAAEGYASLDDLLKKTKLSRNRHFAEGKGSLYIAKIVEVDSSKVSRPTPPKQSAVIREEDPAAIRKEMQELAKQKPTPAIQKKMRVLRFRLRLAENAGERGRELGAGFRAAAQREADQVFPVLPPGQAGWERLVRLQDELRAERAQEILDEAYKDRDEEAPESMVKFAALPFSEDDERDAAAPPKKTHTSSRFVNRQEAGLVEMISILEKDFAKFRGVMTIKDTMEQRLDAYRKRVKEFEIDFGMDIEAAIEEALGDLSVEGIEVLPGFQSGLTEKEQYDNLKRISQDLEKSPAAKISGYKALWGDINLPWKERRNKVAPGLPVDLVSPRETQTLALIINETIAELAEDFDVKSIESLILNEMKISSLRELRTYPEILTELKAFADNLTTAEEMIIEETERIAEEAEETKATIESGNAQALESFVSTLMTYASETHDLDLSFEEIAAYEYKKNSAALRALLRAPRAINRLVRETTQGQMNMMSDKVVAEVQKVFAVEFGKSDNAGNLVEAHITPAFAKALIDLSRQDLLLDIADTFEDPDHDQKQVVKEIEKNLVPEKPLAPKAQKALASVVGDRIANQMRNIARVLSSEKELKEFAAKNLFSPNYMRGLLVKKHKELRREVEMAIAKARAESKKDRKAALAKALQKRYEVFTKKKTEFNAIISDQSTLVAFFDALYMHANSMKIDEKFFQDPNAFPKRGLSSKAVFYDPAQIVGWMKTLGADRFTYTDKVVIVPGEKIRQERPFEERVEMVRQIFKTMNIDGDFFTKEGFNKEAIGNLTAENLELIRNELAPHMQEIEKVLQLTESEDTFRGTKKLANVSGYNTYLTSVVKKITFYNKDGVKRTLDNPDKATIDKILAADPSAEMEWQEVGYMKEGEIKKLGEIRYVKKGERRSILDSPVYVVSVDGGDPIQMFKVEAEKLTRSGRTVKIIHREPYHQKVMMRVGGKVEKKNLTLTEVKRLKSVFKKSVVEFNKKLHGTPKQALSRPGVTAVLLEPMSRTPIFAYDATTDILPLYEKAVAMGAVSQKDMTKHEVRLELLAEINSKFVPGLGAAEKAKLEKEKAVLQDRIAGFNNFIKGAVLSQNFKNTLVTSESFFEDMKRRYPLHDINGEPLKIEDYFDMFTSATSLPFYVAKLQKMHTEEKLAKLEKIFSGTDKSRLEGSANVVKEHLLEKENWADFEAVIAEKKKIEEIKDPKNRNLVARAVQIADRYRENITVAGVDQAVINTIVEEKVFNQAEETITVDEIIAKPKRLNAFEKELVKKHPGLTIGRLHSLKAHAFYKTITKLFGADLVVVSGPAYESRYLSKGSDGRPKIIINIDSPTAFHRIYGHEIFHHVVAKAAPAEYMAFKKAAIKIIGPEGYKQIVDQFHFERGQFPPIKPGMEETADLGWLIRDLAEREISQEEFFAEVMAVTIAEKGFYERLSKTFAGKSLASKIIAWLIDRVTDVVKIFNKTHQDKAYAKSLLLNEEKQKWLNILFADFVGDTLFKDQDPLTAVERYNTPFGRKSLEELQGYAKNTKGWLQGTWKNTFPPGSRSRSHVVEKIEGLVDVLIKWIRKIKPTSFWADFYSEPRVITLMNQMVYGPNKHVSVFRNTVLNKHKDAFKNWTLQEQINFHDNFVRGRMNAYVYKDDTGQEVATANKADIPFGRKWRNMPVEIEGGPINVLTPEGVEMAKRMGYSDELIEALIAFKQTADDIWVMLKKFFPDLQKTATHYGQSIKWFKKSGEPLDRSYDWNAPSEYSFLEGRKQFLKGKNFETTTEEIAEKYNLEFLHMDPMRMLEEYVADAYKVIYFHKTMAQALKEGYAIIDTNNGKASRAGFRPVNDGATKIMQNMAVPSGYKLLVTSPTGDATYHKFENRDETDPEKHQDAVFVSMTEATTIARAYEAKGYSVTVEEIKLDRQATITSYRLKAIDKKGKVKDLNLVYRMNERREAVLKANEIQAMINEEIKDGTKVFVEPVVSAGELSQVAQIYFHPDMANMMNNVLAADLVRRNRFGRKMVEWKNTITSIEFAVSLFHAMTIGQELLSSTSGWTWSRMKQNKNFSWKEYLKSFNPATALRDSKKIAVLMEAVLADRKLAEHPAVMRKAKELLRTDSADVVETIIQFYGAGGLLGMDKSIRSNVHYEGVMRYKMGDAKVEIINDECVITLPKGDKLPGFVPGWFGEYAPFSRQAIKDSMNEVWEKHIRETPNHPLVAAFKTGKFALMEGTTAWLMEQGIPRIKMAVFAREYSLELDRYKDDIASGKTTKEFIARNTIKFLEDRFGEVNWQNTWIAPTQKTILQFLFRSFTWFTGSWNAAAKAGIDFTKWGWLRVARGEKYELTSRGVWAINAVIAHLMVVALIYSAYLVNLGLSGGGEADDEETPWLTMLLFPRTDPLDPEARVSIPSYVTEWYKLARHLAIIGDEFEPIKTISGRFNSILGKSIDVFWTNEDFRGVTIRNEADSFVEQFLDAAWHMAPLPISVSAGTKDLKNKGFDAVNVALGALGIQDAPAAAKRSEAANVAFHVRRKEYKGRAIDADEMAMKDEVKKAAYQWGKGNKKLMQKLLAEQKISIREFRNALERVQMIDGQRNPSYKDPLSAAMKGLTIKGALKVWSRMTDREKETHRAEIMEKYRNMKEASFRSPEYKKEVLESMYDSGVFKR